mgnify:CR=1 FL=1
MDHITAFLKCQLIELIYLHSYDQSVHWSLSSLYSNIRKNKLPQKTEKLCVCMWHIYGPERPPISVSLVGNQINIELLAFSQTWMENLREKLLSMASNLDSSLGANMFCMEHQAIVNFFASSLIFPINKYILHKMKIG